MPLNNCPRLLIENCLHQAFFSELNFLQGKGEGLAVERSGLNDNWDDAEGYYGKYLAQISLLIFSIAFLPLG